MNELVFLDTETTGIDLLVDHVFQVSYFYNGKLYSGYFKPPLPISVKSQSITHITNKMVEDKEDFKDSKMKEDLNELLKENILVGHNAMFDIDMLAREGVIVPRFICTLKVARFLDEENVIPEYNLQYLRYYWGLEIEAKAHEAKDDVKVLEAVFQKMYAMMLEKYQTHDAAIEKMIEVSQKPSLFSIFKFGKHKGKKIEEVLAYDRPYIEWMLEQKLQSEYEDEDWIFSLKHHLKIKD